MRPKEIVKNVYWAGALDWDRRLFDSLIPLPQGTSYNAYIIKGSEKTALIDTVDPSMTETLLGYLKQMELPRIDYVISNHAEQDHSGSIPQVLEMYPDARVICTPKGKSELIDLLPIEQERFDTVDDGQELSLGGKTLRFIHLPWVHWPETMVTYLVEDGILFPCDFLGAHYASSDLYVTDKEAVYLAAKRYYAEIMMPFRTMIERNLEKIKGYDFKIIAPSHGPLYDHPKEILDAYREWVYGEPDNLVVVPYVTMHGSTKRMVDHLAGALVDRGVRVKRFDLTTVDLGELGIALVDAATIVLAAPTVLMGAHPLALYAAYLTNALRPKVRFVSLIGSYGWSTRAVDQVSDILANLKVEALKPVIIKGAPRPEDFAALDGLADEIASKHREQGLTAMAA